MSIDKILKRYDLEKPADIAKYFFHTVQNVSSLPIYTAKSEPGLERKKSLKLIILESLNRIESENEQILYLNEVYNELLTLTPIITKFNPPYWEFLEYVENQLISCQESKKEKFRTQIESKSIIGETYNFFRDVENADFVPEIDMENSIKKFTDNFNPDKYLKLCRDFDLFLVIRNREMTIGSLELQVKKFKGKISDEEYNKEKLLNEYPILYIEDSISDDKTRFWEKYLLRSTYIHKIEKIKIDTNLTLSFLQSLIIKLWDEHIIDKITLKEIWSDEKYMFLKRGNFVDELDRIRDGKLSVLEQISFLEDVTNNYQEEKLKVLQYALQNYLSFKLIFHKLKELKIIKDEYFKFSAFNRNIIPPYVNPLDFLKNDSENPTNWLITKWKNELSILEYYSPPNIIQEKGNLTLELFCVKSIYTRRLRIVEEEFQNEYKNIYKFESRVKSKVKELYPLIDFEEAISSSDYVTKTGLPDPLPIAKNYYKETNSKNLPYDVDEIHLVMKKTKEYLETNPQIDSILGHITNITNKCDNLSGGREAKSNWIKHYSKKAGLE